MTYFTSDNRGFDSFEAAKSHCIANPGVSMCRREGGHAYQRKPSASATSPTSSADQERIAALESVVADLLSRIAALESKPKRRTKAKAQDTVPPPEYEDYAAQ